MGWFCLCFHLTLAWWANRSSSNSNSKDSWQLAKIYLKIHVGMLTERQLSVKMPLEEVLSTYNVLVLLFASHALSMPTLLFVIFSDPLKAQKYPKASKHHVRFVLLTGSKASWKYLW